MQVALTQISSTQNKKNNCVQSAFFLTSIHTLVNTDTYEYVKANVMQT